MKKLLSLAVFMLLASIAASTQDMKGSSSDTAPSGAMMSVDPAKAVFDLSGMAPGIVPFSGENAAQAAAARKRVVYYFAASWCPTCRETYRDLKANFKNVPPDFMIVVVDFDKSAALKAKYGVTSQHTYVSIGPKGELLKIWSGSMKLADIIKNAAKM